ncbi:MULTISPECIES: peptidase inhibitor family I36 protein [Streptomyces]|uniref:peptidase inhibitor family I36 protein n=1 Tax=Streptomyces TaxID=1883 RepID=UPI0023DD479B|nr:peptidase inhibitor family I36 protein [Streptomyces sp. FXJ1.172]WEP00611.1 peptidase inhibitor family I36 protein [Streptomyces sp. FXJ1.172]
MLRNTKKRLAALAVGLTAVGTTVIGAASAAQASDGGCDAKYYQLCFYSNNGYTGASYKVPWGTYVGSTNADVGLRMPSGLYDNVSSLVNNTGQTVYLAKGSGQIVLRVSPYHHLSYLGSADNQTEYVSLYL